MIYHASTLGQLRRAVDGLIERLGEDAPVGVLDASRARLDPLLALDWVVVDRATGRITGDEANDHRAGPGEQNAVRVA